MDAEPLILLVEDDADDADLARLALRSSGLPHRLEVASDGHAALERLLPSSGVRPDPPALVLLDLKLPRVPGKEVLRRLRSDPSGREVPVVVVSSSDEVRDIGECYSLGANSYLRKPVDFHTFEENARTLLRYWLQVNVLPPTAGAPDVVPPRDPWCGQSERRPQILGARQPPGARAVVVDGDPHDGARIATALANVIGVPSVQRFETSNAVVAHLTTQGVCAGDRPADCPHLVVLGLRLADGDGRETLRKLRETINHRLTVVMLVRPVEASVVHDCYALGVNSLVFKPDSSDRYGDVLELLADYWLRLNRIPPAHAMPMPGEKEPA